MTLSFKEALPFEAPLNYDIDDYWDACKKAIRTMVEDGYFAGVMWAEEVALMSYIPLKVLPHVHAIVVADDITESHLDMICRLMRGYRGYGFYSRNDGWYRGFAGRVFTDISIEARPILKQEELAFVIAYSSKTLDIVTPYDLEFDAIENGSEQQEDEEEERPSIWQLNQNKNEFLAGLEYFSFRRHQFQYKGVLDARARRKYIGVPRAVRNTEEHRAYIRGLLQGNRQLASDASILGMPLETTQAAIQMTAEAYSPLH